FLVGTGPVFCSARYHHAVPRSHRDKMVPELDPELSLPHQEELVFIVMLVPGEFALNLDEFDLLTVQAGDDLRTPMIAEERELLGQADFLGHGHFLASCI